MGYMESYGLDEDWCDVRDPDEEQQIAEVMEERTERDRDEEFMPWTRDEPMPNPWGPAW